MKLNRSKNTKRSIFWGGMSKIVMLVFPFLVRSVIIKTVGIDYLGLSGLYTSILEILNLTELGVGAAIVYSMYKPIAENDTETICALQNLFKKIYRYIGLVILVVGIGILPFLTSLIHGEVPTGANIYLLYLIYLGNTVVGYWLFAYKTSLLNAYQRYDIVSVVTMILNILLNVVQIVVLLTFKNFYFYALVFPIITILINFVNAYYANKLFPELQCAGTVSKELKADIKKRVAGLMMSKIAFRARYSLGNIVVSAFLGIKLVAIYNNYFYIANALTAFLTIIIVSMGAGIGNSIATESVAKNEKDMEILNFSYLSVSFFCFCFLLCLYQPFMQLWMGQEYMLSDGLMIWFAFFFLSEKALSIPGQYYDASGLWWEGKWKGVIEVSIHLVLISLMSWQWGIKGTLVSTVLSMTFVGLPLLCYYLFRYYFKKAFIKFVVKQVVLLLLFSGIGLGTFYASKYVAGLFDTNLVFYLLVRASVTLVSSVGLYLIVFGRTKICRNSIQWCKTRIIR